LPVGHGTLAAVLLLRVALLLAAARATVGAAAASAARGVRLCAEARPRLPGERPALHARAVPRRIRALLLALRTRRDVLEVRGRRRPRLRERAEVQLGAQCLRPGWRVGAQWASLKKATG